MFKTILLLMLCIALLLSPATYAESAAPLQTWEAEDGRIGDGLHIASTVPEYSGSGYVEGFVSTAGPWELDISIPEAGHYAFTIRTCSSGYKENLFLVDGKEVGKTRTQGTGEFEECTIRCVYLEAGSHTLGLGVTWGWILLDAIFITPDSPVSEHYYEDISPVPVNPNADENARQLMAQLVSLYGEKTMCGQFAAPNSSNEIAAIKGLTGMRPSMRGFDFMFMSPAAEWPSTYEIDYAMDWASRGGLVTFTWHWFAPIGPSQFATEAADFDLRRAVTDIDLALLSPEEIEALYRNGDITEEAYLLIRDIDVISGYLKQFRDAGVTVLWRPLHEASGGWFWWGQYGKDPYLWLYKLMFHRQNEYHNLTNLLWVWNGQHKDWYPGDEYCDLVGADLYMLEHSYGSQADEFIRYAEMCGGRKIVTMSENGVVPDPESMVRDNAMWLYYVTWYGDFVVNGYNRITNKYTERTQLEKVYDSERTIKLENMADYGFDMP